MSKRLFDRLRPLLVLLVSLVVLTGCYQAGTVLAIDDTLPVTPELALSPYWIFDTAYSLDPDNQEIDEEYFRGLGAYLSKDRIIIGTDSVETPNLKVMQVRTYEYFLTRYKIAPEQVGLTADKLLVYTATDAKGFAVRVYQLNEAKIAIERNNILLYFNRTDKLADTNIQVSTDSQGNPVKPPVSNANGVLLGLRKARITTGGVPGPADYRTIWIAWERGTPLKIYEVPDILFPRDVFYSLKVDRQENLDVVRETIQIKNLSDNSVVVQTPPPANTSRLTDLTFISNDYFSAISGLYPGRAIGPMKYYSTRSVFKPDLESKVAITDLFGPEGLNVMTVAAENALAGQDAAGLAGLGELDLTSFVLKRYNGRWIYEGRISALDPAQDKHLTYPMNLRDNFRVYRYDTLTPRWSEIKSRVPDAVDAVSSPERFFTVVRTRSRLLIFRLLEDGRLAGEPMARLELEEEEIMMHEWARGSFVAEWNKVVMPLGRPLD